MEALSDAHNSESGSVCPRSRTLQNWAELSKWPCSHEEMGEETFPCVRAWKPLQSGKEEAKGEAWNYLKGCYRSYRGFKQQLHKVIADPVQPPKILPNYVFPL